eukprot:Gregarina_sp_Pseudo_9__2407@NODE_2704_length_906_cov_5_416378_g2477_i0_p1_GENE_NODE_2704_length_906_cov_5_416378_g2477_i0NODE_2704_length_906_cov_5_416378_g2477_i0_p1_ORF_typecomplete_len137_score26_38TFIIE_beta/PF02186_15/0_32TFIIE_beta/PF02186_15/5_5e03_NODE_2704_length_906_cov_5_416378_g2477_i0454864
MMAARRVQEMAPPSVASFELLKTKASMYKLQDVLTEMAMYAAEKDWGMTMRLLNLSQEKKHFNLTENKDYRSMMHLRESLIELSSENVAIESLKSLLVGKKVNPQELFRRHQDQRRRIINMKGKLEALTSLAVAKG